MPNNPASVDTRDRLARIARLWHDLQEASWRADEYKVLIDRIRQEPDAFRRSLDDDDPTEVVVAIRLA